MMHGRDYYPNNGYLAKLLIEQFRLNIKKSHFYKGLNERTDCLPIT